MDDADVPELVHPCPHCGATVDEVTGIGRPPTYCSAACRYANGVRVKRERRLARRVALRREAA